jgi:hypothetical protein
LAARSLVTVRPVLARKSAKSAFSWRFAKPELACEVETDQDMPGPDETGEVEVAAKHDGKHARANFWVTQQNLAKQKGGRPLYQFKERKRPVAVVAKGAAASGDAAKPEVAAPAPEAPSVTAPAPKE